MQSLIDFIPDGQRQALDLPLGTFGIKDTSDGAGVAVSIKALDDGGTYEIVKIPTREPCNEVSKTEIVIGDKKDKAFVFDKPARLPRVVLTCLGTGRYRQMAIDALQSAADFFGGDCDPSFHVITDNITGVPAHLNPAYAPYRQWPESGLQKFYDINSGLRDHIQHADYFFFMDADVRFKDNVLLADVAGDLTAVEHPMYPRYDFGWCKCGPAHKQKEGTCDKNTNGFCQYPYERKPASTAYIPEGHGRYVREGKFVVQNWYYLQSAFWGGKSAKVINALDELIPQIDTDRDNNYFSTIIQDERHLNYYFWKHSNDSDINIRMLSPSYLYPYNARGFTDWVSKENRAIIVHGIGKKPGKLVVGAIEIFNQGSKRCIDLFSGKPVGFYGCHHVADSQGFFWNKDGDKRMRTASTGIAKCIDGTDVKAGSPVKLETCDTKFPAQQWTFTSTEMLKNKVSGLCLDPMVDPKRHPENKGNDRTPLYVVECEEEYIYQKFKACLTRLLPDVCG